MAIGYDGYKGYGTPENIANTREIIRALMAKQRGGSVNSVGEGIGEGLSALGDGIVANVLGRRADGAEAAGQDAWAQEWGAITAGLGGEVPGMGAEMAASDPGASATDVQPVALTGGKEEFVAALLPAAIEESQRTGVDPRIIVAQAAQETGWGKSAPGNNFFGIKSHGKEGGQTFTTHEVINGQRVKINDSFRSFASPGDSVRGYGDFLLENPRYKPLREAQGLDAQLEALQASGYATDPNYSRSVGAIARGIPLPVQVASNDPAAAIQAIAPIEQPSAATAYVDPQVVSMSQQGGATLSDPSQISPEDQQRLAELRGPAPSSVPYEGPGAQYNEPTLVYDRSGMRMERPSESRAADQMAGQVNAIPQQMAAASPQLAGADPSKGILAALLGNSTGPAQGDFPAAPGQQQMAQAQPQRQGPSIAQLLKAAQNPYAPRAAQGVIQALIEKQMSAGDPLTQLQIKKAEAELKKLQNGPSAEIKIAGDRAFRLNADGTVEDVTPKDGTAGQPGQFRFPGTSVEAAALNGLIDSGQLTPEQAQQMGAGKTITGPNGEIIFMTPQGVFGNGGAPQQQGGVDIFGDGQGAPPPQAQPQASQTMIPLTAPKVTVDEKKAMTFADRMTTSGSIIDSMGMEGSGKYDRLAGEIPLVGEYLTSDEYKKVDAAKRDFINAQLRRESGAVIADSEFANAEKQYFPQPNDPPEVIEQKRRLRQQVIAGMQRDSGPTYMPPGTDVAPAKPRLKFNPTTGALE